MREVTDNTVGILILVGLFVLPILCWVLTLFKKKKKAKEDDDLVSVTVTAEVTSEDIDLSDK